MRLSAQPIAVGFGLLLALQALGPSLAHAGVPRACIHPNYDPIECPRQTRLELYDVLESARIRELERQRRELEGQVVPQQLEEQNQMLRDIRDLLRYPIRRR